MKREELTRYLDELLEQGASGIIAQTACKWKDGLRCAPGRRRHRHPGPARCAVARAADAILVHHGWFWRGEDGRVTGIRKARLQTLLSTTSTSSPITCRSTAIPSSATTRSWPGASAGCPTAASASRTSAGTDDLEKPDPALRPSPTRRPRCSARRCSSATANAWSAASPGVRRAQGLFEQAIALGVDLYLSGEISEQTVHLARESGVAYLAAGHHASERYGVQALAEHLAERFGLDCQFRRYRQPCLKHNTRSRYGYVFPPAAAGVRPRCRRQ
jgi:hypothetical protein